MARTVDYRKKADKIKEQIDELYNDLMEEKNSSPSGSNKKIKLSDLDFENCDLITLANIQAKISRIIIEKTNKPSNQ